MTSMDSLPSISLYSALLSLFFDVYNITVSSTSRATTSKPEEETKDKPTNEPNEITTKKEETKRTEPKKIDELELN